MNIGDRVRLLHGKEEGTVRKVSGARIEVEIEDGFIIPALKSEVVVIAEAEKSYFGEHAGAAKEPEALLPISAPKDQGLYLAFLPINDQNLSLYLINDSHQPYLAHASEVYGGNQRTLFAGTLNPGESRKFDDRLMKELDEWPAFLLRFIPMTQFFRHLSKAPILGKDVYLFAMEQTTKELDIRSLNAQLQEISPKPEPIRVAKPARSIDLHIEQLHPNPDSLSNSEKMRIQLEVFEKNLNQALSSGMDEITFIHGLGNGVLRKEIHRRLSQIQNIKYFQDTQKDQWGYGATLVRIS